MLQNRPPTVNLILAGNFEKIQPGQQVTYTVEVSDPEDGESKYQEIPASEVFVEIRHFADQPATEITGNSTMNIPTGLLLLRQSNCFDCHQWRTELVGPAFTSISEKYGSQHAAQLVSSIIHGSRDQWSNEIMPAQNLSTTQAREIVDWLLEAGKQPGLDITRGLSGYFTTLPRWNHGYILVTASYTDHGLGSSGENRLTGSHSLLLEIDTEP